MKFSMGGHSSLLHFSARGRCDAMMRGILVQACRSLCLRLTDLNKGCCAPGETGRPDITC